MKNKINDEEYIRVKNIVDLVVTDFNNSGKSVNKSREEFVCELVDELLINIETDEFSTIELYILVLKNLESLETIDIDFVVEHLPMIKKAQ